MQDRPEAVPISARVLPSQLSETNPATVTVKSSLGASATFPITVNLRYS